MLEPWSPEENHKVEPQPKDRERETTAPRSPSDPATLVGSELTRQASVGAFTDQEQTEVAHEVVWEVEFGRDGLRTRGRQTHVLTPVSRPDRRREDTRITTRASSRNRLFSAPDVSENKEICGSV